MNFTWEDIQFGVDTLCIDIRREGSSILDIIAIARGGAVPAVWISNKLNIRNVHYLPSVRYDTGVKRDFIPNLPKISNEMQILNVPTTLVIDDICDEGGTLNWVKQYLPNCTFRTLVMKDPIPGITDNLKCVWQVPKHTWVQFPWEV